MPDSMTTTPPAENPSKDQAAAQPQPAFDVALQSFWQKNRNIFLIASIALLLVVVGREAWAYHAASQEEEVRVAFGRAADRPEQLAAFAKANEGHELAAIATLRIADQRYAAGDYRQAQENYTKAAAGLKNAELLGRARVGVAMSQLHAGDKAGGETTLKAMAADAALAKETRAEANYHLAALAKEAGNAAEVTRLVAEISKVDPTGIWSRRATALVAAP